MKVVLTSGVFDILHPGHLYYLNQAKKLGDPTSPRLRGTSRLVVIVTSDETARSQGKQPIFDERERAEIVSQLKMVDRVVIGRSGKSYEGILDVWPEVIAIGWDQNNKFKVQNEKLRINDEGILELRTALIKYRWQGQIVRIGKLPEYEVSSSMVKDGIVKSLSQMSNLKTQIYNSKLKTEARSFKI